MALKAPKPIKHHEKYPQKIMRMKSPRALTAFSIFSAVFISCLPVCVCAYLSNIAPDLVKSNFYFQGPQVAQNPCFFPLSVYESGSPTIRIFRIEGVRGYRDFKALGTTGEASVSGAYLVFQERHEDLEVNLLGLECLKRYT